METKYLLTYQIAAVSKLNFIFKQVGYNFFHFNHTFTKNTPHQPKTLQTIQQRSTHNDKPSQKSRFYRHHQTNVQEIRDKFPIEQIQKRRHPSQ